jgi:hypothetical protein
VIQKINGTPTYDASAMAELRDSLPPDTPIQLEVARGAQNFAVAVTPVRGCRFRAASIEVLDDALRIEVSLPWLLAMAAKRLLPILRKEARLLLEKR